ncbi:hypothetical protein ACFOGJ_13850 [Marinibaculum pumilum]|uniref:Uncharacterized protein n=1 Tax=Marinibaculum pumilum TaxID=1766165 RepID=A0ABV7L1U2_9PROT
MTGAKRGLATAAAAGLAALLLSGPVAADSGSRSLTCAGDGLEQFVANTPMQLHPTGAPRSWRGQVMLRRMTGGTVEAEMACRAGASGECSLEVPGGTALPIRQRVGPLEEANVCALATAVAGMGYLRLR